MAPRQLSLDYRAVLILFLPAFLIPLPLPRHLRRLIAVIDYLINPYILLAALLLMFP